MLGRIPFEASFEGATLDSCRAVDVLRLETSSSNRSRNAWAFRVSSGADTRRRTVALAIPPPSLACKAPDGVVSSKPRRRDETPVVEAWAVAASGRDIFPGDARGVGRK